MERKFESRNDRVARASHLCREIEDMSLSNFTVGDLEALMGLMGLVDGITSTLHPTKEDIEIIESRLEALGERANKSDNS